MVIHLHYIIVDRPLIWWISLSIKRQVNRGRFAVDKQDFGKDKIKYPDIWV